MHTTWWDLGRRAVTVVLVAVVLLSVPQLAMAAFTGRVAPTLSVGSASMVAPTAVQGTYACQRIGKEESVSVTVTGFTDKGPAGSTYIVRLLDDHGVVQATATATPARTAVLTSGQSFDRSATDWVVTITAQLKSWTSPASINSLPCKRSGGGGGSL